jgi:hypothetical protein
VIATASWFAPLPPDHVRIGISRGVPKGMDYCPNMRILAPGPWFKSVTPAEFVVRYRAILDRLDPQGLADELHRYGPHPTIVCWEQPQAIHAGRSWCHRHLVAAWLEDKLGIEVPEVGWPDLDRFRLLRNAGILPPRSR